MIIYLKTEKEIERFKESGRITAKILQKVLDNVKIGITTLELDEIARQECKIQNVIPTFLGYKGFPAAICASNNNVLVHGIPNNSPLKYGDVLSIDFGAEIDGFIGDSAETIIVGDTNHNLKNACNLALNKSIIVAKDGNKLSDISTEIYNVAKSFGYSIPTKYGGHGIDRCFMHAPPFIPNIPNKELDFTLRAGMIIAIEPMFIMGNSNNTSVFSDGWSVMTESISAHCEHTVLVGSDYGIALTERIKER